MARGANGQIKKHPKSKKKKPAPPMREPMAIDRKSPVWRIAAIRINESWANGMASIQLLQQEDGVSDHYRLVAFLVDIHGIGLKDAFIKANVSRRVFERLDRQRHMMAGAPEMVSCTEELLRRLVFGGIVWARRQGFRTPTEVLRIAERVLGPTPDFEGDDLSEFGYEGRALLVGPFEDLRPFLGSGVPHHQLREDKQ